MNPTTPEHASDPSSAEGSEGLSPEELEQQPFNINGPSGTDEKTSDDAATSHDIDDEKLEQQPFDINGPGSTPE